MTKETTFLWWPSHTGACKDVYHHITIIEKQNWVELKRVGYLNQWSWVFENSGNNSKWFQATKSGKNQEEICTIKHMVTACIPLLWVQCLQWYSGDYLAPFPHHSLCLTSWNVESNHFWHRGHTNPAQCFPTMHIFLDSAEAKVLLPAAWDDQTWPLWIKFKWTPDAWLTAQISRPSGTQPTCRIVL